MATSALRAQNFFSTTLSSSISASDTTISLNSVPSNAEGYLIIEPDNATNREIIYFTSKTASAVVCPSAGAGRGQDGTTATSHAAGASVKMTFVNAYWDALRDGTGLGDGSITNAKLSTSTGEIGAAWQLWTPTLTVLTIGNGTASGRFRQLGKTIEFQLLITFGSTSSMGSGSPTYTLPVTANSFTSGSGKALSMGSAIATDISASQIFQLATYIDNSTTVGTIRRPSSDPSQLVALSSALPFTWATGDTIGLMGRYEAA